MALQTKTRTLNLETAAPQEATVPTEWADAAGAFNSMLNEPEFLRQCQEQGIDISNRRSIDYAKAVDAYAREQCEGLLADELIDSNEASRRLMIACFPLYLHQETTLQALKQRGYKNLTKPERRAYHGVLKDDVIAYNQLVSDYLYTNPDTQLSDIARSTIEAASTYSPLGLAETVSQQSTMLSGARTEAVSCGLLDRIKQMAPFFNYRRGTIDQDKRGVDAVVSIDNKDINVDFKASLDGVESTGDGEFVQHIPGKDYVIVTRNRNGQPHIVVRIVPGYREADLGDGCRLPEDVAKRETFHMMQQLNSAFKEVHP